MALPIVGVEFWVATEPELKYQPGSGDAILNFRGKAQDRTWNKDKGEFENGKSLWVRVTVWRKLAENTADSIKKGDNVILSGKLYTHEYESNGQKRESTELEATEVGVSLRFRTTPHGASGGGNDSRSEGRQGGGSGTGGSTPERATQSVGSDDPGW